MIACSRNYYLVLALALTLSSTACTLRLYDPVPPSEEWVKVVAKNPDRYVLHIEEQVPTMNKAGETAPHVYVAHVTNYQVPSDGLVTLTVPSYRPYCGVYLFNFIKVGGGGEDALKNWEVSVLSGVAVVRTTTLRDLRNLPTDSAGNRLLKLSD